MSARHTYELTHKCTHAHTDVRDTLSHVCVCLPQDLSAEKEQLLIKLMQESEEDHKIVLDRLLLQFICLVIYLMNRAERERERGSERASERRREGGR